MYSTRAESGEKLPKGAKSSDRTGEKKEGPTSAMKQTGPNSIKGTKGVSGEKIPFGATASDMSGERKMPIAGGVGMGKMDGIGAREASHMGRNDGRTGEMNDGSKEREVYSHVRVGHVQDKM